MTIQEEINALLPDNVIGQISAEDIRDAFLNLTEFQFIRGWDRLSNPDSMGDITWDEGATKSFLIAPKPGQSDFHFWSGATKFTKTTSESINLNVSATGTYYIVYNASGELEIVAQSDMNSSYFSMAITGMYYINVEDDVLWYAGDEQHGTMLDPSAHLNMHLTRGVKMGKKSRWRSNRPC